MINEDKILLLLCFQSLPVIITNAIDESDIVIDNLDLNYKILRQGHKFTQSIHQLINKGILIGSYSSKNITKQAELFNNIGVDPSNIYFLNKENVSTFIPPNRACLRNNQIVYSHYEGIYSRPKIIERLAFHSGLKVHKQNTIVIENSKAQFKFLSGQKYRKVYLESGNLLPILTDILANIQLYQKEYYVSKTPLPNNLLGHTSWDTNRWKIVRERQIQVLPKVELTVKSNYLSNFIYLRGLYYIAKTQYTHESNLQNELKQFASQFIQFCECKVVPIQTIRSYVKCAKVSELQTKCAYYAVSPYIANLKRFSASDNIFATNRFNGKRIRGLGAILFFAFLFGEQFSVKSLFSQMGYVERDQIEVFRYDFYALFKCRRTEFNELIVHPIKVEIANCHQQILEQFRQTINKLSQIPQHHYELLLTQSKWRFITQETIQLFMEAKALLIKNYEDNNMIKRTSLNYLIESKYTEQEEFREIKLNLKKRYNFNIVGNIVNMRSIKKLLKQQGYYVDYVSLLNTPLEEYAKIKKCSKALRDNIVLIVDHCQMHTVKQLQSDVNDFMIIFVYRMAKEDIKNNRLPVIKSSLTSKQFQTKQELTLTILQSLRTHSKSDYEIYNEYIDIWIQIQSFEFQIPQSRIREYLDSFLQFKNGYHEVEKHLITSSKEKYCLPIQLEELQFQPFIQKFMYFRYILQNIEKGEPFILDVNFKNSYEEWFTRHYDTEKLKCTLIDSLSQTTKAILVYNILQLLKLHQVSYAHKESYLTEDETVKDIFYSQNTLYVVGQKNIFVYETIQFNLIFNQSILAKQFDFFQQNLYVLEENRIRQLSLTHKKFTDLEKQPKSLQENLNFKMYENGECFFYDDNRIIREQVQTTFQTNIKKIKVFNQLIFVLTQNSKLTILKQNQRILELGEVNDFNIEKNNLLVATCNEIQIVDIDTKQRLHTLKHQKPIINFCFGPQNEFYCNLGEQFIYIWDLKLNAVKGRIYELGFIPQKMKLVNQNRLLLLSKSGLAKLIQI